MKDKRPIAIAITVGVVLIALHFLIRTGGKSPWPKDRVKEDSNQRLVMGTFGRVIAVAGDSAAALKSIEAAFEEIAIVEKLMSYHNEDSQINNVNRNAYKAPVEVSERTFEVLQRSVEFSGITGGAFDITVGPMVDLWHLAGQRQSVPTEAQLQQARGKVGYEKLILDANEMSVRFTVDGMKLDLGGIAKGYSIDKAIEAMRNSGAIGGMVDIGGDIRCFGAPPPGKKRWRIALQDPGEVTATFGSGYLLTLGFAESAVATSGDYRRFVLVEGQKYSHIISPATSSAAKELSSVSIIAATATEADALATAVSVMGQEKGLALIESLENVEAILIPAGARQRTIQTKGAKRYIEK